MNIELPEDLGNQLKALAKSCQEPDLARFVESLMKSYSMIAMIIKRVGPENFNELLTGKIELVDGNLMIGEENKVQPTRGIL